MHSEGPQNCYEFWGRRNRRNVVVAWPLVPGHVDVMAIATWASGGMVYTQDLKSCGLMPVWVRVPPRLPMKLPQGRLFCLLTFLDTLPSF